MTLPKMNLAPESAAWGRAMEKLVLEGKKIATQHHSQITANNQQNFAAVAAGAAAIDNVAAIGDDIVLGRSEPNTPTNIVVTSAGSWDITGAAQSSISVTWDLLDIIVDSVPISFPAAAQFEIWWKPTLLGEDGYIRLGTTKTAPYDAFGFTAGVLMDLRVRAVTALGIKGGFSLPATFTLANPSNTLLAPSTPVLTSSMSSIKVHWDGILSNGMVAPMQAAYASAYVSDTIDGTYSVVGQSILGAGDIVIAGLSPGATQWVKLMLTDTLGRTTPLSTAASIIVESIDLTLTDENIIPGSLHVWPFQNNTIPSGAFVSGSVGSGDIANFAISAIKFNDKRHHIY